MDSLETALALGAGPVLFANGARAAALPSIEQSIISKTKDGGDQAHTRPSVRLLAAHEGLLRFPFRAGNQTTTLTSFAGI